MRKMKPRGIANAMGRGKGKKVGLRKRAGATTANYTTMPIGKTSGVKKFSPSPFNNLSKKPAARKPKPYKFS